MTALFILLVIALLIVLLLYSRATLTLQYRDTIEITLSVLGLRFPLYPKKKKKVKISDYSIKSIQKRRLKEQKKALKKRKKKNKPPIRDNEQTKKRSVSQNLRILRGVAAPLSKRFFGHLRLCATHIHILVATGDAASTAILFGIINQSVIYLLEILDSFGSLRHGKSENISVKPDFTSDKTSVDIKLDFSLRIHHILDILIQTVALYLKEKNKK